MEMYKIKRYKISKELREAVEAHPYSMREMGRRLGFEVKTIFNKNVTINENHLNKLKTLLNIEPKLDEIEFDFTKNLGIDSFSKPIKNLKKDERLAEFIGIILGDGNIYRNCVKIAFDKRNTHYINYVKNLHKQIFSIELRRYILKKTNNAYLYCYNHYLVDELIKLGLKRGDKIKNQIGIPSWIKENKDFSKACLRGLIDTDGCIYHCKRDKQTYIKFTNHNEKLKKDFLQISKILGFNFVKTNHKDLVLYRKNQVANFIKDIKPLKSVYGVMV